MQNTTRKIYEGEIYQCKIHKCAEKAQIWSAHSTPGWQGTQPSNRRRG